MVTVNYRSCSSLFQVESMINIMLHAQMSWHLRNTCWEPKLFCNLHQVNLKLLLQHTLYEPQFYAIPEKSSEQTNQFRMWYLIRLIIKLTSHLGNFTSRLPASPKYTGRSSARPTATRSLASWQNLHISVIELKKGSRVIS